MVRSTLIAATGMALLASAPVDARGASNLYVRVGPGINATIRTAEMHLSCSDNASCRFEVQPNATYDIVASGAPGRQFRWSGCQAQFQADVCRVEVRDGAAVITVR
jgi:hypothetical protein